jgi:hypothetical protein
VKFAGFAAIVACVAGLACDPDPASEVKVIARPVATATPVAAADSGTSVNPVPVKKSELNVYVPGPAFRAEQCNVEPETSKGQSTFSVKGICAFEQQSDVKCSAVADDFYTALLRQGPGKSTVAIYMNIETIHPPRPGKYTGAQMTLSVQDGQSYHHWSSDSVTATIGPGMNYVDIPTTRLQPEPPNTGTEIVSGRFWCLPDKEFAPIIVR